MKISELIEKLLVIKNEQGDLNVGVADSHEYWGSIETELTEYNMAVKAVFLSDSKELEKSVIFSYSQL